MAKKLKISRNTFFIGSGKGGVGKSTISVNLAISLADQGYSVGLLDADVYGPSIPIMMGLRRQIPRVRKSTGNIEKIVPFSKFGIKTISIGFFVEETRYILWRTPLLQGTLAKMLTEVDWGPLDYFIIDLPTGTGDVPLILSQNLRIDGALIVCTPQKVAMLDAIKAIKSFNHLHVSIAGIIENMAGFTAPDSKETYHLFGQGNGVELAQRYEVPLIGSIPFLPSIAHSSDMGTPSAFGNHSDVAKQHFNSVASAFIKISQKQIATPLGTA